MGSTPPNSQLYHSTIGNKQNPTHRFVTESGVEKQALPREPSFRLENLCVLNSQIDAK